MGAVRHPTKDIWDKAQILGTVLGAVLIPLAVAAASYVLTRGSNEVAVANAKVEQARLVHELLRAIAQGTTQDRKAAALALKIAFPEEASRLEEVLSDDAKRQAVDQVSDLMRADVAALGQNVSFDGAEMRWSTIELSEPMVFSQFTPPCLAIERVEFSSSDLLLRFEPSDGGEPIAISSGPSGTVWLNPPVLVPTGSLAFCERKGTGQRLMGDVCYAYGSYASTPAPAMNLLGLYALAVVLASLGALALRRQQAFD